MSQDKQMGDPIFVNDQTAREQWLAVRKEAGLLIDPETAEVEWTYAFTLDPYGIYPDLPEELQQVGREYFARSPGSNVWVRFSDVPKEARDALWEKHRVKLAFPAGMAWKKQCLRSNKALGPIRGTASTEQKPGLDDASSAPRPKNWAAVQAKRALRPSKEAILEAIKASNANVSESARRLGVDRATLWRWMQEDEELMTFRNELREEKLDFVENKLWENIEKGYSKDIQFYLRCQGRARGWIEVTRFEGADGGPIQHQIRTAPEITIDGRLLETEELRELVSLIRKNAIDLSDEELLRLRDLRKKAQPPMIDVTPENRTVENVAIEASKENKESTDVGRT